jgi:hypothetical protein
LFSTVPPTGLPTADTVQRDDGVSLSESLAKIVLQSSTFAVSSFVLAASAAANGAAFEELVRVVSNESIAPPESPSSSVGVTRTKTLSPSTACDAGRLVPVAPLIGVVPLYHWIARVTA